jgi:hypothetical protein
MTSDHVPILVEIQNNKIGKKKDEYSSKKTYNFNKANWEMFQQNLPENVQPNIVDDVEKLNNFIVQCLLQAADNSIPTIYKNDKHKHSKSLPSFIIQLIESRKVYRKEMMKKSNKNEENKKMYNILTKTIRKEIDSLKDNEWQSFLEKQGKNPLNSKPFWQRLNKLKGIKTNKNIPTLKKDHQIYEKEDEKANSFAEILKKTFSDQNDEKFNEHHKEKIEQTIKNHDFNKHSYNKKNCFSLKELNKIIKKLKNHSSPGQDNIHNLMIKNTSTKFRLIILSLINLTIKKNQLPNNWKSSIITMIPKKGANSSDPKDYRPISLTSCLAKISEKLIALRLKKFLKVNKIIIKQQSGFRNNRQTKDNICFITQKVKEQFNRGKKACGILFDIASAFDKVWHDGLIFKLMKLKIPSYIICWFKEFLNNRHFVVKIGSTLSQINRITAGVPQGAATSPILFSLYINDIPLMHKRNKEYCLLFADDLISLKFFKKKGNIQRHINVYLNKVETWLKKWRLMMAPHKCHYIIFSQNHRDQESLDLFLFEKKLSLIENPTFLGIRFDKTLSFRNQISYLQESCLNRLNFLKVVSKRNYGLSLNTLNQLYVSLIRSVLEYSAILFPIMSQSAFNKLNSIQNKAVKIINRKSIYSSSSLIKTSIENLEERFNNLNVRYFIKATQNDNEIIKELLNDYKQFSLNRIIKQDTILCKYKTILEL